MSPSPMRFGLSFAAMPYRDLRIGPLIMNYDRMEIKRNGLRWEFETVPDSLADDGEKIHRQRINHVQN